MALTVSGDHIHLDFSGTDPQVSAALNVPTDGRTHPFLAHGLLGYILSEDPDIPKAGSMLRPVTVTLPQGSIVNPEFPAACGVRYGTALRLTDLVLGALSQAVPGRVPAAGAGASSPVVCSLFDPVTGRRHVTVVEPMQGGGGARSNQDGLHACDTTMGFLRNTPIESIEADIPIVMRRYHLVPDSAGAGRYRGGMGVRMDFQVFHPDAIVTARGMERFKLQPWGVAGGVCGSTGHTIVNPGSPQERSVGKIDYLRLNPGDTVSIQSPAGGGYGDPLDRDPEAVAADVRAELVSAGSARDQCGVVLNDDAVDIKATATLRRQLRREHGPGLSFDYGPFRRALEESWPPTVSAECVRLVSQLPISVRDYVKHRVFEALQEVARIRPLEPADVRVAWEAIKGPLERALA